MKLFNYGFQNSIENITKSFFSKIYYGSIKVTFPSGNIAIFTGKKDGYSADIKIFKASLISCKTDMPVDKIIFFLNLPICLK